eukprot:3261473-Rhodomonas_salina.1
MPCADRAYGGASTASWGTARWHAGSTMSSTSSSTTTRSGSLWYLALSTWCSPFSYLVFSLCRLPSFTVQLMTFRFNWWDYTRRGDQSRRTSRVTLVGGALC